VRAADPHEAEVRLWRALQLHLDFPRFHNHLNTRIHIFRGDLTGGQFGLGDDEYGRLVETTDSVIHCAASLNRKSEKSCLNVNLRGTLEVVRLAMHARDHHGLRRFSHVSTVAVVRPAIVETAVAKPFVGWNEGINTSASLSYLLGTYFRQLPTNERKRLDIIPVDAVCRGMTLIAAAVVEQRHETIYQLATSVTNPCDMRRSIELTSLAHRKHYRAQEGLEYWLRLRFDAIPVSKERYERMSAPAQRAIIKSIQAVMAPLALKRPPLQKAERSLEKVEKLIGLFEPFILQNEHDFVADNVETLSGALVAEERGTFGYDTRSLDWWDYWINIHIPALRRWTYPLIEGRPLEARPRRRLQLAPETADGEAMRTGTNGATWRYS